MSKNSGIFVVLLLCFLSVCSSLTIEDFEEIQHYESTSSGFWPMPGANIENNGYSDMAKLNFDSASPKQVLTNDEGITRSPPVMDRNGFVYTVQKTNTSNNFPICTVECYDPSKNDFHLWTRDLQGYPLDGPCEQALISFNSANSFITLVDSYLYFFTLNQNNSEVPIPATPHYMGYSSSLLIPLTEHYFVVDDISTRDLHIVYYYVEANCTNSTSSNCSVEPYIVDRATNLQSDPTHSPAAHFVQSTAVATGLQDAPVLHMFIAEEDRLYAYNVETHTIKWNVTLTAPQKFMSNVVVAAGTDYPPVIFALVVTNTADSQIILYGYDLNGTQTFTQSLFHPGGEERTPGRLSVDLHHHTVIVSIEQAPGNDTTVYAFTYTNGTSIKNRDLGEANFQGPVSVDWEGKYYIITSQYTGYLVLSSSDLSTVDRVLNVTGGTSNGVPRNYAALGDGTLVVTGSNGVVGFAPPVDHHSSGSPSNHRLVIILLCVFGGLILIVLILAIIGLLYHYYNRNQKQGYEQI